MCMWRGVTPMLGRTILLVLLAFTGGCDQFSHTPSPVRAPSVQPTDESSQLSVAPSPVSTPSVEPPGDNLQLPDMSDWMDAAKVSGQDALVVYGVRDPTAPNMLLNYWLLHAKPPDPVCAMIHPETTRALQKDAALIVDLHDVPLTEELRSQLAGLREVCWLRLSAGVTAADLRWLGPMSQLRGISLTHADLTNGDFRSLASIESLQWLALARSQMSATDFCTLPRLDKLQTLWLSGNHVTDAYLDHLAELRLPSLRTLGLNNTSVTDDGIHELCEVYDLKYLELFFCKRVTERSVESIAGMKRLRMLGAGWSGIAPQCIPTEAVDELKRLLPKCNVDFSP